MNQESPTTTRPVRIASMALAAEMVLLGLPASVAPRTFYSWFPFGRGWVAGSGPDNEHLVSDFGYAAVALGIVLGWAAVRPGLELSRAALVAALATNAPHTLFHLVHATGLPRVDTVVQNGLLVAATLVNLVALGWTVRNAEALRAHERRRDRSR